MKNFIAFFTLSLVTSTSLLEAMKTKGDDHERPHASKSSAPTLSEDGQFYIDGKPSVKNPTLKGLIEVQLDCDDTPMSIHTPTVSAMKVGRCPVEEVIDLFNSNLSTSAEYLSIFYKGKHLKTTSVSKDGLVNESLPIDKSLKSEFDICNKEDIKVIGWHPAKGYNYLPIVVVSNYGEDYPSDEEESDVKNAVKSFDPTFSKDGQLYNYKTGIPIVHNPTFEGLIEVEADFVSNEKIRFFTRPGKLSEWAEYISIFYKRGFGQLGTESVSKEGFEHEHFHDLAQSFVKSYELGYFKGIDEIRIIGWHPEKGYNDLMINVVSPHISGADAE